MDTTYRFLGIAVLLLATGGLCVQYAATDHWSYPSPGDISADPEAYTGEQVLLFGDVESIDHTNEEIVMGVGGRSTSLELIVEDVTPEIILDLESGGEIQVYGTLQEDASVIVADEVVVDYRHDGDRRYVLGTSILGGLLATGYFLWYWRINLRRFQFEPRGDG